MILLFEKLDIIKGLHKFKGTVQDANIFLKTVFADCYFKKKSRIGNLEACWGYGLQSVSVQLSTSSIYPIHKTHTSIPICTTESFWELLENLSLSPALLRLLSCTCPSFCKCSTPQDHQPISQTAQIPAWQSSASPSNTRCFFHGYQQ